MIRLNRVVRDIPNKDKEGNLYIYGGNKVTNHRQIIHNKMKKENKGTCKCIRCREIKTKNTPSEMQIVYREYVSSNGKEYFISMESGESNQSYIKNNEWNDKYGKHENWILYGFIRLRLSQNAGANNERFPELKNCAFIRELHVHGEVVSNNENKSCNSVQHRGIGKELVKFAERQANISGFKKIAVISGIGVRQYYARIGYQHVNTYMIKNIDESGIIIITLLIMIIHMFIVFMY